MISSLGSGGAAEDLEEQDRVRARGDRDEDGLRGGAVEVDGWRQGCEWGGARIDGASQVEGAGGDVVDADTEVSCAGVAIEKVEMTGTGVAGDVGGDANRFDDCSSVGE